MELIGLLRDHAAILTADAGNLVVQSLGDERKLDDARQIALEAVGFTQFADLLEKIGIGQFDFHSIKQPTLRSVYDKTPDT